MNSTYAAKPFSALELAAGAAALVAVALIAFIGLRVPRPQVSSPGETASPNNTVSPPSQSLTRVSTEQRSERGAIRKSPPVAVSRAKAGSASSMQLPASAVPPADSAATSSPNLQTQASPDPMQAASANHTGKARAQIAVQQPPLADEVATEHAPTQRLTPSPPPQTHWSSIFATPADTGAADPTPLPRKRPRLLALTQAAIPLPRERPNLGEPQAPAGSRDWLSGIFRPAPSSTAEPGPVHQGNY